VKYWYASTTSTNPDGVVAKGIGIGTIQIYDGAGTLVESTNTTYTDLPVYFGIAPGVKEVVVERHGREFKTTYTYTTTSTNFYNFHRPSSVLTTGHFSRTTAYTYQHLTGPWILALPLTEQVTVGTEVHKRGWTYDALGFKTSDIAWFRGTSLSGIVTQYTRDSSGNGNIATRRISSRPATSFTYQWGRVSLESRPLFAISRVVNPDGTIASETRAGRTASFQYDDLMRQTLATPPGGGAPTQFEYDNVDGASATIRRGAAFTTTTLDGFGRPVATIDSQGVETRTTYDAEGRVRFQSRPLDASHPEALVETQYDSLDRITKRINADGTFSLKSYSDGLITATDENGHATELRFAATGRPDGARIVSLKDAALSTWSYTHNALNVLTKVTAPDNVERSWVYDTLNRLSQQIQPESGTTLFTYDTSGKHLLKTRKDANNVTFTYTYDTNDRVTRVVKGTSARFTQTIYEGGSDNVASIRTENVWTDFSYDGAGRLASRTDLAGTEAFTSAYEYDASGNVAKMTYPSGREVSYAYNSQNLVQRVFEQSTNTDYANNIVYHPTGAVKAYVAGNLTTTAIERDPTRQWVQTLVSGPLQLSYADYDLVGNVQALNDSAGYNQVFAYDQLDRLIAADGPYGSIVYQYNVHGNRTTANATAYTYQSTTLRLSSQGGTSFTYDPNGNTLTAGGATYTYTPTNMVATAQVAGNTSGYLYDGQDQRIQTTIGGSSTYSVRSGNGQLLTELQHPEADGMWRDYIYAGSHLVASVTRPVAQGMQRIIDFESGASLGALGFTRIIDLSNQQGEGLSGSSWGMRGATGSSSSAAYYGEASLPVTPNGRQFEFEAEFDHADAGYSQYGYSAFEMRLQTHTNYAVWFFSLYHGYGDTPTDRSQLVLYGLTPEELYSGPGVIIPGTRQRITVRGTLSTITDSEVNSDGAVQVLVDGVVVFDVAGVEVGWNYFGPNAVQNGIALWDRLMVGPMGRLDNLRIDAGPVVGGPDTVVYYHSDAIGSVRAVTDSGGQIVERFDYLPFGERWSPGTTVEKLGFAGKDFDQETGLNYFGARYHASINGRFTTVDPVQGQLTDPQSLNRYAYAKNNPLRFVDPTGLYVVDSACLEDKRCATEAKRFEQERLRALRSTNADVAAAAAAYGDLGTANGVTVNFADQKTVQSVCGPGAAACATPRYVGDVATGAMNPAINVLVRSGLTGTALQRTVVHEGSHVSDQLGFIRSWDLATTSFDAAKNMTIYATEFKAYQLETFVDPTTPHSLRGRLPAQTGALIDAFLKSSPIYSPTLNNWLFSPEFTKPR